VSTRLGAVNVRRRIAAAVLALGAPALTACTVNFDEQTDAVYNPAAGVDDRSGSVDVLNALVVSGSDGSGAVVASLVNNDRQNEDSLKGVAGAGKDAPLQVTPGGSTTIPAGGLLNLAKDGQVQVRGERVVPGNFLELTFTFDRGEPVTVMTPVVPADNPAYGDVQVPSGS
jgi:hypothetical protein